MLQGEKRSHLNNSAKFIGLDVAIYRSSLPLYSLLSITI